MKHIVLISLLIFSSATFAQTAKEKDVRKLLELTGSAQRAMQVMKQIISIYKESNTNVPDKFWDEVEKEINPNELIEMMIPVYVKYYSEEDVKQLIAFYESPLGQKYISVSPQVTQDAMAVGYEWGQNLGNKIKLKLEHSGY